MPRKTFPLTSKKASLEEAAKLEAISGWGWFDDPDQVRWGGGPGCDPRNSTPDVPSEQVARPAEEAGQLQAPLVS